MCSAMAPGPCKATRGSGRGSRGQHRSPLPSQTASTEDPGAPPTFAAAGGRSAAPPRPGEPSRGLPAAAPGSRGLPARVRTDLGLHRVRAPPAPARPPQLAGRGAPLSALMEARAGAGRPARPPATHWSAARGRPAPEGVGGPRYGRCCCGGRGAARAPRAVL